MSDVSNNRLAARSALAQFGDVFMHATHPPFGKGRLVTASVAPVGQVPNPGAVETLGFCRAIYSSMSSRNPARARCSKKLAQRAAGFTFSGDNPYISM